MSRKRGDEKGSPALPAFLRPILWEYEFADLSWEADRDTIVFKILSSGDWNSVRWLRSELGAGQLPPVAAGHARTGVGPGTDSILGTGAGSPSQGGGRMAGMR